MITKFNEFINESNENASFGTIKKVLQLNLEKLLSNKDELKIYASEDNTKEDETDQLKRKSEKQKKENDSIIINLFTNNKDFDVDKYIDIIKKTADKNDLVVSLFDEKTLIKNKSKELSNKQYKLQIQLSHKENWTLNKLRKKL